MTDMILNRRTCGQQRSEGVCLSVFVSFKRLQHTFVCFFFKLQIQHHITRSMSLLLLLFFNSQALQKNTTTAIALNNRPFSFSRFRFSTYDIINHIVLLLFEFASVVVVVVISIIIIDVIVEEVEAVVIHNIYLRKNERLANMPSSPILCTRRSKSTRATTKTTIYTYKGCINNNNTTTKSYPRAKNQTQSKLNYNATKLLCCCC